MGWRIILQPNGLLARFSEVVDDFTHVDLDQEQAIKVCVRESMFAWAAWDMVERALRDEHPRYVPPIQHSGRGDKLDRWREAIEVIRARHGKERAKEREEQGARTP